jgi:glycosyltransferase involved in cell wall biosynthesis
LEQNRTALLITYYWPPAGGAGVHRWLRFSRYFKENGWDVHVYCPENAAWPTLDPSLEKDVPQDLTVIRKPIFEPHKYLGKKNNPNQGSGITQQKEGSLIQRFIIWVRGNLFIPDARVFWIKPSTRFLNNYLKDHPEIDTIISTGPPHSMHLIAQELKKRHPKIQWVADFRDPWTEIDFYQDLLPGKWADRRHKKLEQSVLKEADKVVTISQTGALDLERIGKREVEVITNGFIFPEFDAKSIELDQKFSIAHYGSMPFARNPQVLWDALQELVIENPEIAAKLQIRLVGPVDFHVLQNIEVAGLTPYLEQISNVSHQESLDMQRKTQVLLLVANRSGNVKGILTGKFFEYLGAKRPILAIGEKNSDLESAMNHTNAGHFVGYDKKELVKEYLRSSFLSYSNQMLYHEATNLEEFSSAGLAKKFIGLLTN